MKILFSNKGFKMGNSKVRELLKELVEVFFTTDRLIIAIKLEFHKISYQYHLFGSKYKSRLNRVVFLVNKAVREYH